MGVGQQYIKIVIGQNQQLATGIAGTGLVSVIVGEDVVDVTVAFLVIHRDTAGDLAIDDRAPTGNRPAALVVVPYVGLRGKSSVQRLDSWSG